MTSPPRERTEIPVVPPPISITIPPLDSKTEGISAPYAAAIVSSIRYTSRAPADSAASTTALFSTGVIPIGTETTTLGLTRKLFL